MDRNDELPYGVLDTIEAPRSTWTRKFTHKTSFNAGSLIPFYFNMDIIPGTTIKNQTSMVVRMATPIYPVLDNLYLDFYYFKCSKFWYWEHWREMMGENNSSAWTQTVDYEEPYIYTQSSGTYAGYGANDFLCYIGGAVQNDSNEGTYGTGTAYSTVTGDGIRTGCSKIAVNCYIDVWNQWFRDQNLQAPIEFDKTDANLLSDGTIQTGYGTLKVAKFHDYFTSALPQPQKGEAITTPIGTTAPVIGTGYAMGYTVGTASGYAMTYQDSSSSSLGIRTYSTQPAVGDSSSSGSQVGSLNQFAGLATDGETSGVIADLTQATAATINALRLSFATQRILEKDARFGTRYVEILKGHFGVTASDESLLRPEYLGGERIPINIETVLQNSSTDDESPLGETGAFSVTTAVNEDFTKSFTKDDILIGVLCVRADHTYQQGIDRQFTRTGRLDRYWPSLAHIGNQPIYNYEIYVNGTDTDLEVFGYKEAWQEYMYSNNRISGEMNSNYYLSLDSWHYGDDYSSLPVLSDEWIQEPTEFIDRTIAVTSELSHQFWCDIYVEQVVTAPIPISRTPGLIDHF